MDLGETTAFLLILITICLILVYRYSKKYVNSYQEECLLNPGTHRIGEDFPPGKGDLKAIEGKGEVCIKKRGTSRQILRFKLHADGLTSPTGYRNLTLQAQDVLEITGSLQVIVTSARAFSEYDILELSQGTYVFGCDLPAAKYNLKVAGGSGTVRYYEPGAEESAFSQEMGDDNATIYENLLCAAGGRMTIEGLLKLELTPSKKQHGTMQKVLDFLNQTP